MSFDFTKVQKSLGDFTELMFPKVSEREPNTITPATPNQDERDPLLFSYYGTLVTDPSGPILNSHNQ